MHHKHKPIIHQKFYTFEPLFDFLYNRRFEVCSDGDSMAGKPLFTDKYPLTLNGNEAVECSTWAIMVTMLCIKPAKKWDLNYQSTATQNESLC